MNKMEKMVCDECNWHGTVQEMLVAPNPFEPDENIYACPNCKNINTLFRACDAPGCWKRSTCGTSLKNRYMITCGKHMPIRESVGAIDNYDERGAMK